MEHRQRVLEGAAAEHVRVEVSALPHIRAENASTKKPLEMLQRLQISPVQLHFERRLRAVTRKGTLSYDEPNGVAQGERIHGRNLCNVAHIHKVPRFTFLRTADLSGWQ